MTLSAWDALAIPIPVRPPTSVVMAGVGMLIVKLVVLVGQATMIGAVLTAAVKSVFVSLLMVCGLSAMDASVLLVITCVGVDFVMFSEGGGDHKSQR